MKSVKGNKKKNKRKMPAFRREKRNLFPVFVAVVLVSCFCGFMQYRSHILKQTMDGLEADITDLQTKIASEEKRGEDLKEFEIYTHTKKYAEEVAKDILGYVYDDEIIFKPEE